MNKFTDYSLFQMEAKVKLESKKGALANTLTEVLIF